MLENHRTRKRKKRVNRKRLFFSAIVTIAFFCAVFIMIYQFENQITAPPQPTQYQISYNRTPMRRGKNEIKYIVIHDTANKKSGADALHHYYFFNSGNQNSSADYFVDDKSILKVNDFYSYYTWHCGDGNGKNGITNQNSIGVEICVNQDGNYKQAVANTVSLVKELMTELEIAPDHVVRHYDASGKNCPAAMQGNSWKQWNAFKEQLSVTEN